MTYLYPPWPQAPSDTAQDPSPPFVSYAQNFEDVILWRALHHIDAGFYIDVGAGDPDAESVTRAFYERGWHGINVEPARETCRRLAARRSRDVNINAALLDREGTVTFYPVDGGNGLSTVVAELADQHRSLGWAVSDGVEVAGDTLANVCRRYAAGQPIHFLKIDVEGAERQVVLGGDFASFRPWILIIETEGPRSSRDVEEPVLAAGYCFVHFDGLNRFYIASEHYERLRAAFFAPPNVYDRFVRAAEAEASACADRLTEQLADLNGAVEGSRAEARELQETLAAAETGRAALVQQLAEAERLREQLATAEIERASFVQQLFESARHEAWLALERTRLIDEASRLETDRLHILTSRSWRLTAALRALGRGVRRMT